MQLTQRRLPELHLPEMNLDDIVRSVSAFEPRDAIANIEMPKIDLGRAAADAAAAVHLQPRSSGLRRRWAVSGLIISGVMAGGWILLTNTSVRERVQALVDGIRDRFEAMPSDDIDDDDDPVGLPNGDTAPIATMDSEDPLMPDPSYYPHDLGTDETDDLTAKVGGSKAT